MSQTPSPDPVPSLSAGEADPKKPRYEAIIWWCGDDVCDCNQPQIILRTPNHLTRGDRLTMVWEGTFKSGGVTAGLQEELEAECARRGIPLGLSYATDVTPEQVREINEKAQVEYDAAIARLDRGVS